MARDKNTCNNFIGWYKEEFGFTAIAATAQHDMQMLKTASTLSELNDVPLQISARQSVKTPASQIPK
jgi:hypothetical protein